MAAFRAATLSPIWATTEGAGPMNRSPASIHACAKSARSDKNPYPKIKILKHPWWINSILSVDLIKRGYIIFLHTRMNSIHIVFLQNKTFSLFIKLYTNLISRNSTMLYLCNFNNLRKIQIRLNRFFSYAN